MPVLMIFWDGVGIGRRDPKSNPFFRANLPTFDVLLGGKRFSVRHSRIEGKNATVVPLDATFGVEGYPQSGTGQTSIFAGVNASRLLGQHFGPYPHSKLRPIIYSQNIFVQLCRSGKKTYFANAYPQKYFDYLNHPKRKYPVVALASVSAGMPLHDHMQLAAGYAISADIIAAKWKDFGHHDVHPVTAADAGKKFAQLGRSLDFTLFEYFVTDPAGHQRDMEKSIAALETMDAFVGGILQSFDHDKDVLLIVSDHGNIEDLSMKTHTRNRVPLIVVGRSRHFFTSRISRLDHVTPAVVHFLTMR